MTDQIPTVRGLKLSGRERRPKVVEERRVCAESTCDTVLSRYNSSETCHRHSPTRFPRVRGVVESPGV